MNIIEWILKSLGLREKTEQEKFKDRLKQIEIKIAENQLRLAREQDRPEPDVLKIERYEKEIAFWKSEFEKEKKKTTYQEPEEKIDVEKYKRNLKAMEDYRDKAVLKLSVERNKQEPDMLKIDVYKKEIARWNSDIAKVKEAISKEENSPE